MKKKNNTVQIKEGSVLENSTGFCLSSVLRNLKKYFLPWLILAVLSVVVTVGANIFFSKDVDAISSTISFNYNGIEAGLDPNGCEFDTDAIKNDRIVSDALSAMGLSGDLLETVQNGIFIDGIVSNSAIDKITQYDSIYDSATTSSSGAWIESIRDTSYHPTQYRVSFNYNSTGLSGDDAAELLNRILENYQTYFFETYGYSEAVSHAVLSVGNSAYDYLITLDMYNSTIRSLEDYTDRIASEDQSQFRSSVTGYSFSDLADALGLIRSVDIDTLTSYVLNNGVISDKEMMVSYYNYRIDNLTRARKNMAERLDSVQSSIETYQKDAVIIYDGGDSSTASITETSQTYDNLIHQKIQLQAKVSYYNQQISDYKDRLTAINKVKSDSSASEKAYVEEQLQALEGKIKTLIDNVKATTDDYYENEKFTNAFSIITPASYSFTQYLKSVIEESMRFIIIAEFVFLTIYLFVSIAACFSFGKKKKASVK